MAHPVIDMAAASLARISELSIAYENDHQAAPGVYVQPDQLKIDTKVQSYLRRCYPQGLFRHQFDAISAALSGQHTLVSTPTSSGKSLVFSIPALHALATDDNATAMFIYPQKALANDQLGKLEGMYNAIWNRPPARFLISRYDGGDRDHRREIRERGRIILTNPDMLHLAILSNSKLWATFMRNLKYVVIDEAHVYRGMFGSSVSYVFRRLRAMAKAHGANPVFVSASATIKQGHDHLKLLTGLDFNEIGPERDGSMKGHRRIYLLKGTEHYWQLGRRLTQTLVESDISCLTFCGSRKVAELLLDDVPESIRRDDRIKVYRAGIATEEREQIESDLKTGKVKAVFCTSALELGIDIGALNAVVCVGLPPTMMSLWQRAGRVGRSGNEGVIFFIAADTPIDSYYVEHPNELFARETEPLAINLQNRRLLCHHLACAIDEAGEENLLDFEILGPHARHAMDLRHQNRLNHDVFYSGDKYSMTPIRTADNQNYELIVDGQERALGDIDYWHMLREAYPKAIYLHSGRRYRVTGVLQSRKEIKLTIERSRNRTIPLILKSVKIRRPRRVIEYSGLKVLDAEILVTESLAGVSEKKPDGTTVQKYEGNQNIGPYRLPTEGVSLEICQPLFLIINGSFRDGMPRPVYETITRLMGSLFPVILGPCDTQDYGAFCDFKDTRAILYLYDQVHDGIELTSQAFEHMGRLLQTVKDRISTCDCGVDKGCFRCVRNPDDDAEVSRRDCLQLLNGIIPMFSREPQNSQTFNVDVLLEVSESAKQCSKCRAPLPAAAIFCMACGEKILGE